MQTNYGELDAIEKRARASTPVIATEGASLWVQHPTPWEPGRRVLATLNIHYPHTADLAFFQAARQDTLRAVELAREALMSAKAPEPLASPRRTPTQATCYPSLVGAMLASVRRRAHASHADVAGALGMTVAAWRSIERGSPRLSLSLLARFSEYAGVEPGEVIARADGARARLEADGVVVTAMRLTSRAAQREHMVLLDAEALAEVLAERHR